MSKDFNLSTYLSQINEILGNVGLGKIGIEGIVEKIRDEEYSVEITGSEESPQEEIKKEEYNRKLGKAVKKIKGLKERVPGNVEFSYKVPLPK